MIKHRRDILKRILERIREYAPALTEETVLEVEKEIREEYGGSEHYIPKQTAKKRTEEIKKKFNGRNAVEVQKQLGVSRSTFYRSLHHKK